ncbi:nuclease [Scytonema sp. UIC 10036]|uniref:nuclease A inhibitor family protein n=1 Tax=Scytonema sp. UIC 10036 TaxID=2304196 RepID=UPI0012DA7CE7|nr:nuclease A inhibitor family protein [Scytonema sp. UIC 10036]MUG91067.1 nuclease [Scytonema sp. UIC 10036]
MSKSPRISGQEHSGLINVLKQASDGLLFMSESEYPFEVFLWDDSAEKDITPELVIQKIGLPLDTPVEIVELDSFFQVAIAEQDWHSSEDKKTVKKFQNLVKILKENLNNIKVMRFGTINIDVYIIGKTANERLAGLSTKVVET